MVHTPDIACPGHMLGACRFRLGFCLSVLHCLRERYSRTAAKPLRCLLLALCYNYLNHVQYIPTVLYWKLGKAWPLLSNAKFWDLDASMITAMPQCFHFTNKNAHSHRLVESPNCWSCRTVLRALAAKRSSQLSVTCRPERIIHVWLRVRRKHDRKRASDYRLGQQRHQALQAWYKQTAD